MTRTEGDSWNLANSVGATATMVAAARAAASRRPQPVISDPYAEPLVRAVGLDTFNRVASGELDSDQAERGLGFPRLTDTFAARARYYDAYFTEAGAAGLRQVVILASGLDARPYRLPWPAGTSVYEIDQPEVIEFKTATLAEIGATPAAGHHAVGVDLRDDWPAELRRAGLDPTQPTAWLAEGVLIGFLPSEAEVRLLDNAIGLSAPGSRFAADFGSVGGSTPESQRQAEAFTEGWRSQGLELDISAMTYPGEHTDVAAYLRGHGWDTTTSTLAELFTAAGLPELSVADQAETAGSLRFVRAVLT